MSTHRLPLLVVLLVLMFAPRAPAGVTTVDSVRFRNFGIDSGLSQVTARAMLQDEQGFLWIGTQDGLNRFDGYSFRTYHRDRRDPHSLGDSHITALARAEHGALWVGTMAGGLNRLDPATEEIQVWRHRKDAPGSLAADSIVALLRVRNGDLWVATSVGGLQRLAPGASEFADLRPSPPADLGVVRDMVEAEDGSVWLAGSRGVWRCAEHAGDSCTRLAAAEPALRDLQAISLAPAGGVWVGTTRSGLLRLAADGQVLARHRAAPGREGALPDDQVRALLTTSSGELWVGTMNGLAIHDAQQDLFLTWHYDAGDAGSPAGNRIAALYEDRDGLVWIGSWTGGFSIHNPATQVVRLIRAHGRDRTSLPASPVRAMWMDADGSLWMGVLEGGGLVHYDLAEGVLQRWVHDPADPASLPGNVVQSIARTPDGHLWVGTQGAGLARMHLDGKGFEQFRREDGSLPDDVVQALYVDRLGELWVGMETGGMGRWRGEGRGFEWFHNDPADPASLQGSNVYCFAETRDGEFWIGTFGSGLARFDRRTHQFRHWREIPGDLGSLSHNSVTMIVEGHDGVLWLGTQGGGLNRVSRSADGELRFAAISKHEGLGADAIGTVVEDRNGRLWIGTTVGVNAYDPKTGDVQRFSASDGMDRSGYFIGSVARGADGSIYFGGLRGVLAFHPERLPRHRRLPELRFTDLRVDNAPVRLQRVDPSSPLPQSIHALDELILPAGLSSLAIDFSALEYANPDGLHFSYQLVGQDRDWVVGAPAAHTAAWTNLASGTYRLNVRARADDEVDWGPQASLRIFIEPEAWRTPLALSLYAMLVLAIALLLWMRTRRRWARERLAAESIRRSEERLKLALWGSRDELWDLDLRSGRMLRENILPIISTSSQVHFASREEFLREVHPDDQPDVLAQLTRHIHGQSEFYENTFRMRTLDGGWCWVLSRGFAVERDGSGRAQRMVGTSRDVSASAEAAEQLRRLNDELEHRVEERTRALRLSNRELQFTLDELKMAQRQLVESEKMAALGNLVAGIAHEINTPLGIGVTAASHLEDETRKLMKLVADGKVSRGALDSYQSEALSSAQLILSNLRRAGQLIKSFKQVAVDQSSEAAREIDLKTYLEEILVSLGPALKKTPHSVSIKCPENLRIHTYPGAVSQIVVNLVMNSLIHAFEGVAHGEIRIECEAYDEEWLLLYRDNGVGMSEEIRQRVFDPFFTTKRGQGGSGLGLHVVYNLVTQLLKGSLDCLSEPGKGVEFQIQLPKRVR